MTMDDATNTATPQAFLNFFVPSHHLNTSLEKALLRMPGMQSENVPAFMDYLSQFYGKSLGDLYDRVDKESIPNIGACIITFESCLGVLGDQNTVIDPDFFRKLIIGSNPLECQHQTTESLSEKIQKIAKLVADLGSAINQEGTAGLTEEGYKNLSQTSDQFSQIVEAISILQDRARDNS